MTLKDSRPSSSSQNGTANTAPLFEYLGSAIDSSPAAFGDHGEWEQFAQSLERHKASHYIGGGAPTSAELEIKGMPVRWVDGELKIGAPDRAAAAELQKAAYRTAEDIEHRGRREKKAELTVDMLREMFLTSLIVSCTAPAKERQSLGYEQAKKDGEAQSAFYFRHVTNLVRENLNDSTDELLGKLEALRVKEKLPDNFVVQNFLKLRAADAVFTRMSEEIVKILSFKYGNKNDLLGLDGTMRDLLKNKNFLQTFRLPTYTTVDTAHPNGKLNAPEEKLVTEMLDNFTHMDDHHLQMVTQWKSPSAKTLIKPEWMNEFWNALQKPGKKQTPEEERERGFGWVRKTLNETRDYMRSFHGLLEEGAVEANASVYKTVELEPRTFHGDSHAIQAEVARRVQEASREAQQRPLDVVEMKRLEAEVAHGFSHHVVGNPFKIDIRLPHKTYSELTSLRKTNWGLKAGFASMEELDMINPVRKRSWVIGDADGKKETTQLTVRDGIREIRRFTLAEYGKQLKEMIAIMADNVEYRLPDGHYITRRTMDAISELRALESKIAEGQHEVQSYRHGISAKEIQETLVAIKEKYELNAEGRPPVVFGEMNNYGEPAGPYSRLDELYVNVKTHGDYVPKVELRQNAAEHRTALHYIAQHLITKGLLKGDADDFADHPERLWPEIDSQPAICTEVQALYNKLNDEFKANPDDLKAAWKDANPEKFYTSQILGFFELMRQYPGAIENYVVADCSLVPPELKASDEKDKWKDAVVTAGQRDYRQMIAFEKMMGIDKDLPVAQRSKITLLFEDPPSIIHSPDFWESVLDEAHHPETQDIRDRVMVGAKVRQIFDVEKGVARDMTQADFKAAQGLKVEAGDETILVIDNQENMKAGSDSGTRGSKGTAPLIGIGRGETRGVCASHVITCTVQGEALHKESSRGVTFHTPQKGKKYVNYIMEHAGVGADKRRSQGSVNAPGTCEIETTQGLQNVFHYGIPSLDTMVKQLNIARRDINHSQKPDVDNRIPDNLRKTDQPYSYQDHLTPEERLAMKGRIINAVYHRMKVVNSVPHDVYFDCRHVAISKETNYSARGAARAEGAEKKKAYPLPMKLGDFRTIGFTKATMDGNDTEVFIRKAFIPDENSVVKVRGAPMLAPSLRFQLMNEYVKNSDMRQFVLDSLEAMITSNMHTGWNSASNSMQDRFTEHNDGDGKGYYIRRINGPRKERIYITDLARMYKDHADATDHSEKVRHEWSGVDFTLGQLMWAETDYQRSEASRAIYELLYRIKHTNRTDAELDAPHQSELENRMKHFRVSMLEELLEPEQQARLQRHRALLDTARRHIAEDHLHRKEHDGKARYTPEELHHAASIYDVLCETGSAASGLRRAMESVQVPVLREARQQIGLAV